MPVQEVARAKSEFCCSRIAKLYVNTRNRFFFFSQTPKRGFFLNFFSHAIIRLRKQKKGTVIDYVNSLVNYAKETAGHSIKFMEEHPQLPEVRFHRSAIFGVFFERGSFFCFLFF
jgi:hypothetical protein